MRLPVKQLSSAKWNILPLLVLVNIIKVRAKPSFKFGVNASTVVRGTWIGERKQTSADQCKLRGGRAERCRLALACRWKQSVASRQRKRVVGVGIATCCTAFLRLVCLSVYAP